MINYCQGCGEQFKQEHMQYCKCGRCLCCQCMPVHVSRTCRLSGYVNNKDLIFDWNYVDKIDSYFSKFEGLKSVFSNTSKKGVETELTFKTSIQSLAKLRISLSYQDFQLQLKQSQGNRNQVINDYLSEIKIQHKQRLEEIASQPIHTNIEQPVKKYQYDAATANETHAFFSTLSQQDALLVIEAYNKHNARTIGDYKKYLAVKKEVK